MALLRRISKVSPFFFSIISEVHQLAAVTSRPEFSKNRGVCESLKKLTNEGHFDNMLIDVDFRGKDASDSGGKPFKTQSADNETYSDPSHKSMKTGKKNTKKCFSPNNRKTLANFK